jgi:hypothetical protein
MLVCLLDHLSFFGPMPANVQVANGVYAIRHEIQPIIKKINSKPTSQQMLSALFPVSKVNTEGYKFFDAMLNRCILAIKDDIDDEEYIQFLSCIFAAIALSTQEDFIKFIVDIFSEGTKLSITESQCESLLTTVFNTDNTERFKYFISFISLSYR